MSELRVLLPDVPALVAAMDAAATRLARVVVLARTARADRVAVDRDGRATGYIATARIEWEEGQPEPDAPPGVSLGETRVDRVYARLGTSQVEVYPEPWEWERCRLLAVTAIRANRLGGAIGHVRDVVPSLPDGSGPRVLAELQGRLRRAGHDDDWRTAELVLSADGRWALHVCGRTLPVQP